MRDFLPIFPGQMKQWDYYDFLFITGDAYVDHPSFGGAIISRLLESLGYRVYVCPQPNYKNCNSLIAYGRPRLGVMISGGNVDSMVNHYTAWKKVRSNDVYSPKNNPKARPDRCVIVYSNRAREAFPNIPLIIGGVEASLRRFAHYDYWSDKVRRSILIDSGADMLVFGMGETQTAAIAKGLEEKNLPTNIPGTAYVSKEPKGLVIPSFQEVSTSKKAYAQATMLIQTNQDPIRGVALSQYHGNQVVVQNLPAPPLTEKQMDRIYSLPYMRQAHPSYEGGIDALKEVSFSITRSRGCYGSCNFCALTMHQGRCISTRSLASVVNEARGFIYDPEFKGYVHDIGGPSANLPLSCDKIQKVGACKDKNCLFPKPCKNLNISHEEYLETLRAVRAIQGIKKVFIRSGIRYDYLMLDKHSDFFNELCAHHISGQLKVAPEHVSSQVLDYMGKPSGKAFDDFLKLYRKHNQRQFLVPYLMSSHPGCRLSHMIELAVYLKNNNLYPEQVQDFYPTPGTISTAMYHTGLDPRTMKSVYVPKDFQEKRMQKALLQFRNRENRGLVYAALKKAKRLDLVGNSPHCLIR